MKKLEGHGKRHYANYPTALENASAVTATIRDRVKRGKTLKLGPYDRSMKDLLPDDCMIFPLGAVEKALEPGVFRALSEPVAQNAPAGHALHWLLPPRPSTPLYDPCRHGSAADAPSGQKLPPLHGLHATAPSAS